MTQTLLAFDYGTRRIGVAAGQDSTGSAQGVATIPTPTAGPQWDKIDALINEWQPDTLVTVTYTHLTLPPIYSV